MRTSPGLLASVLENLTRTVRTRSDEMVRRELERRVELTEMELARHRALTQLVAGLAHEINTPLGIVRTASSVVQQRLASGQLAAFEAEPAARVAFTDVADAAHLIARNVERAHRLVEQFKRLSSSQISDTLETFDLFAAVSEVVELFRLSAREARLTIEVRDRLARDPAARSWYGYRGHLSQILLNLLTNSQRYAYPDGTGGKVDIVVEPDAQPPTGFVVSVRDFGQGIPSETLPRVFEPFFTTGRHAGGTGLRLAIVRNLATDALRGQRLWRLPGFLMSLMLGRDLVVVNSRSRRVSNRPVREATGWAPQVRSAREGWQRLAEASLVTLHEQRLAAG